MPLLLFTVDHTHDEGLHKLSGGEHNDTHGAQEMDTIIVFSMRYDSVASAEQRK